MIERYDAIYEDEEGCECYSDTHKTSKDGDYYLVSDIDPILKAARVLAEGWQSLTNRLDCKCDSCQAARLIIEKTEGLEG